MESELVNKLSSLLPSHITSMLIGKLLGDGSLTIEKNKRPRLRFSHKLHDQQWCHHCRNELVNYISFPPIKYRRIYDKRITRGFTESYYAQSHTHEALDLLKQLWYPSKVKKIPFSLLQSNFTRTSLAWWFMDDGHLKISKDQPAKIILSTESFTHKELETLCSFLKEMLHLDFRIDKAKRLVIYDKVQIYYFLKLVQPFLVSCMYRKTLLKTPYRNIHIPKRTTIYLPMKLTSPTKQIHIALTSLTEKITILSDDAKYLDLYCSMQKNLLMNKHTNYSYQVTLPPHFYIDVLKCQAITGMKLSQIVHWCLIE
jgi:hypothetical protein